MSDDSPDADRSGRSAGPLAGITVLEIGVFMAGPFATMQLADLGARVIKIESPGTGDQTRVVGPHIAGESSAFMRLNRNKESVELDLKSEEGRQHLRRLLARADVLVENLRPGALKKMGLGYDDLKTEFPHLIYASASGWGQDGPLAPNPGLDIMAQARSGLMSITGFPDMPPAKVGVPVCDLSTALYLALAVLAAIHERGRSGQGQFIDVSLFESGVSFAVWEAGAYFANGAVGTPQGSAHQASAPYQAVRAADGYVTIGANTQGNWARLCRALGLGSLIEDERFATPAARMTHRDELIALIEDAFASRSVSDVVSLLDEAGVPVAPINDYGQVFTDPHLRERDFFWDAPHPRAGRVEQIGSPMRFSRTPAVRGQAGPVLGADTERVLAELADEAAREGSAP
ncbi:CaiB/BaiF CoA transferase family protein [Sediminivirga luteola]|uniref:CaiB/BaiF CoA transferase family protein n=1 Tax=Sediminivirga luteola TaxID=1774748 RepID=UPI001F56E0CE|nr:CoA transferase [Sediminivirga luteola]MCI2265568.1 CoA transferase [Sediminivirga luteola]